MPQGLLPGLQPAAAHLRFWPGRIGSRGIDAPQQIAVLVPRLEGGPVQGPRGLRAVQPVLPAPSNLDSVAALAGAQNSDGDCMYLLVVLEQKDRLGKAVQAEND
jgi:hypothetical protein